MYKYKTNGQKIESSMKIKCLFLLEFIEMHILLTFISTFIRYLLCLKNILNKKLLFRPDKWTL